MLEIREPNFELLNFLSIAMIPILITTEFAMASHILSAIHVSQTSQQQRSNTQYCISNIIDFYDILYREFCKL